MHVTFLYADQLLNQPDLAKGMFSDRAAQFHDRLGWDVTVDANGFERDGYDTHNPMYVICHDADGRHRASMRIMPTLGATMVNDHFTDLTDGVAIQSPLIWETTRFCIAPDANKQARLYAGAVMLAGCQLGLEFGLEHAVGVFDARMTRVYKGIGWAPTITGSRGTGREKICAGLWEFSADIRDSVAAKAGITAALGKEWFDASFNPAPIKRLAA